MRAFLTTVCIFGGYAAALPEVESGPAAGAKVPALKVHACTGAQENKDLDYAAERKDKPTLYIFIQADKLARPTGRFLRELDDQIKKDHEQAYVVCVWLTDDKEDARRRLPLINKSLNFQHTALTFFDGDKSGPNDWNVNLDADVTIIIAHKQKVSSSTGYRSLNEMDVQKVRAAFKKAIGA